MSDNGSWFTVRGAFAAMTTGLLAPFQADVLVAIIELKGNAFGTEIRRYLCKVQNRDVAVGQVFTCLAKLENEGLIAGVDDCHADRAARKRRVYALTPHGVLTLQRSKAAALAFDSKPVDQPVFGPTSTATG